MPALDLAAAPTALFLDLDGTLVDIAATPSVVRVPGELAPLVAHVAERLDGALAILSGRTIAAIDAILAPFEPAAAGVHGAELRLVPGGPISAAAPPIPKRWVEIALALAGGHPGLRVEEKTYSVAIHYRGAPRAAPRLEQALRERLHDWPEDLKLAPGRMVFEITSDATSKGAALQTFMRLAPFAGRRPIMVGDDETDETAMAAALELGGLGLAVAGEHFPPARAAFASPAEVRAWLMSFAKEAPR